MINFSTAFTIYESDEIFVIPGMDLVLKDVKLSLGLSLESGNVINGGWYLHSSPDGIKWLGSVHAGASEFWEISVKTPKNSQFVKIPQEIIKNPKIDIFEWAKKVVYKL